MQATKPSADAYARRALARLIQPQPTVDAVGARPDVLPALYRR